MTETLFAWDESFLIGIDELDHEHKQLIDDINRLHEELAGNQKSEVRKWLGEVCARMQAHFALDELLDNCTEYMLQYINDTSASPSSSFEASLKHWVLNHIITSDKKMSLMVQETESYKKGQS